MSSGDRRLVSIIAAAALLVAPACGSSTGSHAAPVSAEKRIVAVDQARAEQALITQDDVPAAFFPVKQTSKSPLCVDESELTLTGDATSDTFKRDDAGYWLGVSNRIVVFPDEDQAKDFFARATETKVYDCIGKQVAEDQTDPSADREWRYTGAKVVESTPIGDQSARIRLGFDLTVGDQQAPIVIDFLVVRVGTAVTAIQLLSLGQPFDKTAGVFAGPSGDDLMQGVVDRLSG